MHNSPTAFVVAGGTRERFDDVRIVEWGNGIVTNVSTGRFGLAIGHALLDRRARLVLAASAGIDQREVSALGAKMVTQFGSFADLEAVLKAAADSHSLCESHPIIFMAAAVSDFSPVPSSGKISSDQEEIDLKFRRNPKLIASFREWYGEHAFLIGFKLVSGVSREIMLAKARKQLETCRLDLVVANDLSRLKENWHPITLVTPEGGAIDFEGTRDEVAVALVDFVLRRSAARRVPIVPMPHDMSYMQHPIRPACAATSFASKSGLLAGGGTASGQGGDRFIWTTPHAGAIDHDQMVLAELAKNGAELGFRLRGPGRAPDDAVTHAWLYRAMPGLKTLIRAPSALALEQATVEFPYPFDTREHADGIQATLARAAIEGRLDPGAGFALRLAHQGWLFGFTDGGVERAARAWDEAVVDYLAHLRASGAGDHFESMALRPIFSGVEVIGVEATHRRYGWSSIFVTKAYQGRGLGERLVARLTADKRRIGVRGGDRAEKFFIAHGYRHVDDQDGMRVMEPPSVRTDLRKAATLCLFNPSTRMVLIGTRKTDPWLDYHCCPGGSLEEDDASLLDAAIRECREETGIDPGNLPPIEESVWYTATGEGGRIGYEVTNFMVPILHVPVPVETKELRSRWMRVDEAVKLAPAGYATRAVLRALDAKLPR